MVYYGTVENGLERGGWSVEVRRRSLLYCFQQISCGQRWIYGITELSIRKVLSFAVVRACVRGGSRDAVLTYIYIYSTFLPWCCLPFVHAVFLRHLVCIVVSFLVLL